MRALLLLLMLAAAAQAQPAPMTRGINLTNWFRFPADRSPAALSGYLSDQALGDLRAAGFDFVRLAIEPEAAADPAPLLAAIRRIQRQGLTVIVSPHPHNWQLEADPAPLRRFWQALAPALRGLDPARTVPEVLNEPVFPHDPAGWARLQHAVLADIRAVLPRSLVVLTGQDWGSIGGLLALRPEADRNVVYSFHFYDPAELTSLAAWRQGIDHTGFARLPFPVADPADCQAIARQQAGATERGMMQYYCAYGWNAAHISETIAQAAAWAKAHDVRLLAGEFGATAALNSAARSAWLATARRAFEAQGIAWALWGYDDIMGFAVPRPPPARPALNPWLLAVLGLSTQK